jgi:neutral ceramidase
MKPLFVFLMAAAQLWSADLRAGVARKDITPRDPIWMSGYASRNHPSVAVRQHLWARALAISDGSRTPTVIVATDVIGLPAEVAEQVAQRVRVKFGIERARLLLNSSHTHTGPVIWPGLATMFTLPPGEEEKLRGYAEQLTGDLVTLVGEAIQDLAPAQLSYGFGRVGFAMNRREATATGVKIGVNPAGPKDDEVPVIRVAAANGQLRAVVMAYACHNTTLNGDFYEITGDYAGFAEAKVEAAHPGTTALFLALCGGDQNPYPRGTITLAEQHGSELAGEVERVLGAVLKPLSGPLRTAYVSTTLAFAKQEPAVYEADLANPRASLAAKRRARAMLDHPVRETAYPVQAIRFGKSLTLLALGGEVVVDYALRAKTEYPGEALIVAAYSNSVMCYIPTERILREGGYEAVDNLVYYGQPGPFAPGVEARVFDAIRAAMKKVGRSR